jgi:hypothetical protein
MDKYLVFVDILLLRYIITYDVAYTDAARHKVVNMFYWELQCMLGAIALIDSGAKKLRERIVMRRLRAALHELQEAHIAFAYNNHESEAALDKAISQAHQIYRYGRRHAVRMRARAAGFARSDADQVRREQLIYSVKRVERLLELLEQAIRQLDPSFM